MKTLSLTKSKDMANVKVFADKQTNRCRDKKTNRQAKIHMPPIYQCGGIKPRLVQIQSTSRWQNKCE